MADIREELKGILLEIAEDVNANDVNYDAIYY